MVTCKTWNVEKEISLKFQKGQFSLKCSIQGAVLVIVPSLIAARLPQTAVQCGSLPVDSVVSIIQ